MLPLIAAFFLPLFFCGALHAAAWDGSSTAEPVLRGGVYEIATPAQLAGLAKWVNVEDKNAAASYRLTADIDLGGHEWTPIGLGTYQGVGLPAGGSPFEGQFDGNGYAIKNFKIASTNYQRHVAGLFGFVRSNGANVAVIQKLTVSGVQIDVRVTKNADYNPIVAGGLVGYQEGTLRIEDCAADVAISANSLSSAAPFGSYVSAYAGGLVGFAAEKLVVKGSSATGSIRTNVTISAGTPTVASMAGGLAGFAGPGLEIADSSAAVNVFADAPADASITSYVNAGGIIGSITYPAGSMSQPARYHLDGLSATGSVYSSGVAGGLVGFARSDMPGDDTIENSFADAAVTLSQASSALASDPERRAGGGLVGVNDGVISTSAAFGDVSGGAVLGGLVGVNYSPGGNVRQSYATGNVTAGAAGAGADAYIGGLIGTNDGIFEDCYARGNVDSSGAFGADAVYVGGVAGEIDNQFAMQPLMLQNVYAYGDVRGRGSENFYVGGLIGHRPQLDGVLGSAWLKPADGSANALLEIATGQNSQGQRGDSDFMTADDMNKHVSSMDVMTPESESTFSQVKGWTISNAASVPATTTWTWTPLDGEAAPVLRAFFADDARTKLNGSSASIAPQTTIIGPGEIKFAALLTLGMTPEDIRVSPATLGGVSIEAASDGRILLRAPNETTEASGSVKVEYKINGYEQQALEFILIAQSGSAGGGSPLEAPTFHNTPTARTWVKNVPIPSVAFSVTQPDTNAAIWTSTSGLPRGVSPWTWTTYTPSGGIAQLDVSLSGKPAAAASGTVETEAMVYSYAPGNNSYPTASNKFAYTVLDDGCPTITGLPSAVQSWERGVAIQPLAIQIDKGVGGKIGDVTVRGLPPGVSASMQPAPSDADIVTVTISGTPSATLASGKVSIEASSANGAVATGEIYFRMTDKGDPYISGVPSVRRDWAIGEPIAPLKIVARQNVSAITDVEVTGLPDGVTFSSAVPQADRVEVSISGTPTAKSAGDIGIFARTAGGASYAEFAYAVIAEGQPLITRVPTATQRWAVNEAIVPVAARIQGRNNVRIVRAETSALPGGLEAMTSHVSSTDIWIAMIGAPSSVGGGVVGIYAEAENGETAEASFFYSMGNEGGGNTVDIITDLPPGIDLGLGGPGYPITYIPPGNIAITERPVPNPNGGMVDEFGNPLPPGVLLPGYGDVGEGSIAISVDLGNGTSGDVLALEYEINLLDHPFFENWPSLDEAERLERLEYADARLVYEYAEQAATRNTPALLIGDGDLIEWADALSEGVARTTDIGLAVRYIITDRDMDPFVSAGFLILPDGKQDDYLIDPLWLLVRDQDGGGSGSGVCGAGYGGFAVAVAAILFVTRRRARGSGA